MELKAIALACLLACSFGQSISSRIDDLADPGRISIAAFRKEIETSTIEVNFKMSALTQKHLNEAGLHGIPRQDADAIKALLGDLQEILHDHRYGDYVRDIWITTSPDFGRRADGTQGIANYCITAHGADFAYPDLFVIDTTTGKYLRLSEDEKKSIRDYISQSVANGISRADTDRRPLPR